MGSPEWMEVYRTYTGEELSTEIAALKKQKSVYSGQNIGAKGYTKDLHELMNQLHAAVRVQNERTHQGDGSSGTVDFSQVRV